MTELNHDQIAKDYSLDAVDRLLDTALARYASVEPRLGLDQRIMANLNAEQSKAPVGSLWQWTLYAGAAVMVLFALILIWKPSGPNKPNMANDGAQRAEPAREVHTQVAVVESGSADSGTGSQRKHVVGRPARAVPTNAARRDQFPSPQPLSEQERLLASYIANDPHHAVLIARAQAELEQRDHEEEIREINASPIQGPKQIQQ